MIVSYTDAHGVSTRQQGVRFGLVSLRTDRTSDGKPAPLHVVEFAGMSIASDRRFPGQGLYLTPEWVLVLADFRRGEDNASICALRVLGPADDVLAAVDAGGPPPCAPELFADARARLAELYGASIPNDYPTFLPRPVRDAFLDI